MNLHRFMVMAVTCAAGLSATACAAGITTVGPAASAPPAPGHTTSSPTRSPSPTGLASPTGPASAGSGGTVSVDAPIGSFPIPPGAQNVVSFSCSKEVLIQLSAVTPSEASTFYTSALPRAGYKITNNTVPTEPGTAALQNTAEISFTGHGYTGLISALARLDTGFPPNTSRPSLPSGPALNIVHIQLTAPGAASTSACPS